MPEITRRVVGRYEILRELGRGSMATVWLARQTQLDRCVALKELKPAQSWDSSFAQRMRRESRRLGSLSHPNIATVFDCFEADGTPYIAMEYVERGSLRAYVGRLTLAQIGGVLEGLLAGLRHAELREVVHGDLKPENLLVTAGGQVKIADFAIADAASETQEDGTALTVTGVTTGTPAYMAPEKAMGQGIGAWTDLYSVGCIAFELFTGRTPFADCEPPMAVLLRQINEPIPPVKSLVPGVDGRLSDWIEQLLVKRPAWRTQHAADALAELEEILVWLLGPLWRRDASLVGRSTVSKPEPVRVERPPAAECPPPAPGHRRWALSAAVAGGIAAVAGIGAVALGSDGRARPVNVSLVSDGIGVEVPAGWRRAAGGAPAVPGVDAGAIAHGPDGQRIVFGRADRSWANHDLLPIALHTGRPARTVTLRSGELVRGHDGVRIDGGSATVYSIPTTRRVATLTCFAEARTCATIGASLRITKGKVLPLGPDARFIRGVGRIFGWLEARERPVAAQLRRARTRAARIAATKRLWWTYAGASKRLRRLDVGPADVLVRRQLAEALRLAGCAYGRAADEGGGAGYAREGELALVHQGDVRRALGGLVDAGYELPADAAAAARFTPLTAS